MAKQKIFKTCTTCLGRGTVVSDSGGYMIETVCPQCNGEKHIEWGYLKTDNPE